MKENEAQGSYVRLLVTLERGPSAEGLAEEWLWAEPLGSGRFRLESTPFFAYGLSYGDLVEAGEGGDMPRLAAIERKSGHRTLRIALDDRRNLDEPEIQKFLDELLALGCAYEAMPPKIVALDVPPEVEVAGVVGPLQTQFRDGVLVWEWADPRPS